MVALLSRSAGRDGISLVNWTSDLPGMVAAVLGFALVGIWYLFLRRWIPWQSVAALAWTAGALALPYLVVALVTKSSRQAVIGVVVAAGGTIGLMWWQVSSRRWLSSRRSRRANGSPNGWPRT